jgi:hypothetical protein
MDLTAIRSAQVGPGTESLTRSLACVLRSAGAQVNYYDLNAALGLSWMTVAVPREPCVARWPAYARDFNVLEAGKRFGLRIRDLHPPDVATGLDRAPEYFQHFDASYRPLIERALEHGQPVLAWQGWPVPHEMMWGIITAKSADGVGFSGVAGGQRVVLATAPIQMYVIEEIAPDRPDERALLRVALEAADRVLRNQLDPRLGVVTGLPAYELWAERIHAGDRCPYTGDCLRKCHSAALAHVWQNRGAARRFLHRHRESLESIMPGAAVTLADAARDASVAFCTDLIVAAANALEVGTARESRQALSAAILTLRADEIRARDMIAAMLERLGRIPHMKSSASSASQRPTA